MKALVVGDQVRWKRGAVGLTGRVIDFIFVPNARIGSASSSRWRRRVARTANTLPILS